MAGKDASGNGPGLVGFYYPDEAATWFLSAYSNHLNGDKELVRRDLFRMIELEGRDPAGPVRKRRYEAVKDIQGEKRDELEKVWQECLKESREGARPITLVPEK